MSWRGEEGIFLTRTSHSHVLARSSGIDKAPPALARCGWVRPQLCAQGGKAVTHVKAGRVNKPGQQPRQRPTKSLLANRGVEYGVSRD